MTDNPSNRSIRIEESAVGSAIVSGDGNIIYVIQQTLEQRREEQRPESTDEIGPNPYKGLAAFKESDADRYFGREVQIERLRLRFQHLWEQTIEPRFLPILGPSGCGKSSLARAGFIPELARQPLPGKERIRVAVMVPGAHPLETLAGVLAKAATDDPLPVEKADEFERVIKKANDAGEYPGLRRIAGLIPSIQDTPLVILVDQFEEVYSLCKDVEQRQAFIDNLFHAASDPTRYVSVVITLRSDFLGETQRHQRLNQIIGSDQSVIVPAMTEDELRRSVAEPAKQAGHPLDEATIDLLVKDTEGREGALPLLQFALSRIWSGLAEGKEPAVTYRQMGGVGGALAGKAQEIYNNLNESEQAIARRIFVGLVQLGEGTRDTRRRVEVGNLMASQDTPEMVDQVLQQFSSPGTRLVSLSSHEGDDIAEVTHEALFAHWQLLNDWLDNSRDDIRFQRRVETAVDYWDKQGRPQGLLWRSPDLDLLRTFEQKARSELSPLSVAFFEASDQLEKAERRRKKWLFRGTVTGLIGMTVLSLFAGYKVHQAARRQMRFYEVTAENLVETDPIDSIVNGLAAVGMGRSAFVRFPNLSPNNRLPSTALLDRPNRNLTAKSVMNRTTLTSSVAISADGQTIVSESAYGSVQLWNRDGSPIGQSLEVHSGEVNSVAISADGQTIVSGGNDGSVQLWNRDGSPIIQLLENHSDTITEDYINAATPVAISADGQTIVSGGNDGSVQLWNRDGSPIGQPLKGHSDGVSSVAISADGKTIVSGSWSGSVQLWNRDGSPIGQPLEGHSDVVSSVAISADGKTIVSGSWSGSVQLWNRDGSPISQPLEGHSDGVNSVAISADSQTIVSGGNDGSVRLWNRDGSPIGQPLEGYSGRVDSVAISGDGHTIVSGSWRGSVQLWNRDESPFIQPLEVHSDVVSSVAISDDGKTIVSGSWRGSVQLWNRDGSPISQPLEGHSDVVSSVAISGDGQTIVSGSDDGSMRLWNRDGSPIGQPLEGHSDGVSSVAISADGKTIVSGSWRGSVQLWNRDGSPIGQPLEGHSDVVSSVAISGNGQTIVSGGNDGSMRLWNRDGSPIGQPLEGHSDGVSSVAISADGKTIVSGSWSGSVQLWNRDGSPIGQPLEGHSGGVSSVAISGDGQTIVSGSVQLWNRDGSPIGQPLEGHSDVVNSVAISGDGQTIVSGSDDGSMRLWPRWLARTGWVSVSCQRLRGYLLVESKTNNDAAREAQRTCDRYGK